MSALDLLYLIDDAQSEFEALGSTRERISQTELELREPRKKKPRRDTGSIQHEHQSNLQNEQDGNNNINADEYNLFLT